MERRYRRSQNDGGSDPLWILLCAFFVVALFLVALPSIILGFIAQRLLARYLHWRLNFAIWLILVIPGILLLFARQLFLHLAGLVLRLDESLLQLFNMILSTGH